MPYLSQTQTQPLAAEGHSLHPAAPRVVHWLVFCALLLHLFGMRWISLNGHYVHPDEVIPHAVVQQMRDSGSLDTNWARADLPPEFRYPQYNFSGYLMAMHAMEAVRCANLNETTCRDTRRVALRQASTVSMAFVWLATYLLIRGLAGPWTAMLGTLGVAASVQLYQDSIYARPEAFCTALFIALLAVTVRGDPRRLSPWIVAGLIAGLLIATKISFLPISALMPALALWRLRCSDGATRRRVAALLSAYGLALFAGTTAGAPYAWIAPDAYLHGVARLSQQYSAGHWPHGNPDFDLPARVLHGAHYLIATAGAATFLLGAAAAMAARRHAAALLVLAGPLFIYTGYFSTSAAFFERNFSHVLPVLYALAALGAAEIAARIAHLRLPPRAAPAAVAAAAVAAGTAVVWPGAEISTRVFDAAVNGSHVDAFVEQRDRLARACDCRRSELIAVDQNWRNPPITAPDTHRRSNAVLLSIAHFGDARSERRLAAIAASPGVTEVGRMASPFDDVPTSSLHVYHAPAVRFFVLAQAEPVAEVISTADARHGAPATDPAPDQSVRSTVYFE